MVIKILGTGCANCKKLYENVQKAVEELVIDADIQKIEDIPGIMRYGVMKTPAVVVDEQVKITGKVAKVDEIKKLLA